MKAVYEVVQIEKGSSLLTGMLYSAGKFGIQASNPVGSENYAQATKQGERSSFVDAGRLYPRAVASSFLQVLFCTVVAAAVVDTGNHVGNREVCFKVEALKAFHSVGSGMSLGKGIASEAFDLPPYFAGLFGRIAPLRTVFKKLHFHCVEFFAGTEFPGHSSPKDVCLGQG